MTRQSLPDICDICGKNITSESQYVFDVYQGKNTFGETIVQAKKKMDACHPCFLKICKNGYKPDWQKKQKNPQYVAGSKVPDEKYWLNIGMEDD